MKANERPIIQTMKGMAMAEGNVKTVAVVTDNTSDMCDQALYLDGVLQMADSTIYACDIAKHGGGDPICFRHFIIDLPEGHQWPQSLGEALQFEQTTENTGVASSG